MFAVRNFKYLGFAMGKNKDGIFIRVHAKSWAKMKAKLKDLSSRRNVQNIRASMKRIEVYARGWLNYYGIADMKNPIAAVDGWLYHRIRMCIWKQWKRPKTKVANLRKLGVPDNIAFMTGNCRRGYWWTSNTVGVKMALTKDRLIRSGFYDLSQAYQSMHVNC